MSSGGQTKRVTTVGRKDISDQIAKQNHNRVIKTTRGDQETNNHKDQGSQEIVITVENQDINKRNAGQGSIH